VSWPGVVPVPESATLRAEFEALEVMARLPLALLPEVGAKVTLRLALCPAFKVRGKVRPLALNPEPVAPAAEIVTLVPPELVIVSASVVVLPVVTFPKLRLAGLVVSWPGVVPVPESATLRAEFEALEVMARLPLALLPEVGAKVTLRLALWPGLKVIGKFIPLALNPEPVALAAEIVTLVPPELVKVSASVALLPVVTFPKLRLAGLVVS